MLKPCFGAPAFVCRLVPIHSLSPSIVTQHLNEIISCVTETEGKIIGFLSDNHPTNHLAYKSFCFDMESPFLGKLEVQPGQLMHLIHVQVHQKQLTEDELLTVDDAVMTTDKSPIFGIK